MPPAIFPKLLNLQRLQSTLQTTGLQTKDQPTYQVLEQLIKALLNLQAIVLALEAAVPVPIPSGGSTEPTIQSAALALIGADNYIDSDFGFSYIPGPKGDKGASGSSSPVYLPGIDGIDGIDEPNIPFNRHSVLPVTENEILLANVTTDNATTTRHGFLPILSNIATQFLNGQGNFATPAGTPNSYFTQAFSAVTSVNVIHGFGAYPEVQVIDGSTGLFIPLSVVHNTLNDFTVTFAVSSTGIVIATVGSPQPQTIIIVPGNYSVLITDFFIEATGATSTITLPTAIGNSGRVFVVDNASVGNITVATLLGQTIEGALTQLIPTNNAIAVYSDGTNYRIF